MQLSYSTLAVVLTTLAVSAPEVAAAPSANEGRTFSLCNLPNFGAPQGPWIHDSKPAAFCGKKPSNSGAWANIVSRLRLICHHSSLTSSLLGMVETPSSAVAGTPA